MYKKVIVSKTDLEITVEKVFSTIARKNISISIYTDEFDLYMFKLFFPASTSKLGYLKDSIAFAEGKLMYPDILNNHAITIVRNPDNILERYKDKAEKIETIGGFQIFYLKDNELKEYDDKKDDEYIKNSKVKCDYVCTLFPPKDGVDTSKLEITNVGVYSITPYKYNLEIVKLIEEKVGKYIIIVDATACVGGDTIGFAINFKRVLSIEKDPINYTALYNNVGVYKLNNVTIFNTSFLFNNNDYDVIMLYRPDVIYFDPPWGGKDYHLHKKLDLFLDGKNIKYIVNDTMKKYNFIKLIVLKVPFNFNYDDIDKLGKVDIHKLKKFHIIMITN